MARFAVVLLLNLLCEQNMLKGGMQSTCSCGAFEPAVAFIQLSHVLIVSNPSAHLLI